MHQKNLFRQGLEVLNKSQQIIAIGMGGMASGMLGKSSDKMPAEPLAIKGSFTLTTDARILANNSEDGPEETGDMQVVRWDIGPAAYGAPMALLKLAN